MSMQVTSSTVTTPTNLNGVDSGAPTTQSTGSTTQLPPQYQLSFGGLTRATGLGLGSPTSVGDVEILFARIASELKDTLDELVSRDRINKSESMRGELGLAMAAFDQMVRWGSEIDMNRENIKVQDQIINTETDTLNRQKNELSALTGAQQGFIDQRDAKQTALDQLIAQNKPENAGAIAQLRSDIASLNGTISSYDAPIQAKKDEIAVTQGKIDKAEESKRNSQSRIAALVELASNFFDNFVSLFIVAMGGMKSENARMSGELPPERGSFEDIMGQVAAALVDAGAKLVDIMQSTATAVQSTGAGLDLERATPDRFGQPSAPVARAMAFAGMIAGTMGAIADLLRNASAGLSMQNAGSMASAGDARVRVPV